MVAEHRDEYPSEWAAFTSIAGKLGMTPETLRVWVRRAQIDEGVRPGLTTDERQKLKDSRRRSKSSGGPTKWQAQLVDATTSVNFSDGVI
jgi:transposase